MIGIANRKWVHNTKLKIWRNGVSSSVHVLILCSKFEKPPLILDGSPFISITFVRIFHQAAVRSTVNSWIGPGIVLTSSCSKAISESEEEEKIVSTRCSVRGDINTQTYTRWKKKQQRPIIIIIGEWTREDTPNYWKRWHEIGDERKKANPITVSQLHWCSFYFIFSLLHFEYLLIIFVKHFVRLFYLCSIVFVSSSIFQYIFFRNTIEIQTWIILAILFSVVIGLSMD